MPQDRSHDYTPKGPQYSEESIKGTILLMLLLTPVMLISSCFKLACSNGSQARADAVPTFTASADPTAPSPEPLPPAPPADL